MLLPATTTTMMVMKRRPTTTSSWCSTFHFFESFFLFGVLTPTGEKIVISISFSFLLVCYGHKLYVCWSYGQELIYVCLVKLLWRFEPYYAYLSLYDYVMTFVIVPC
jgi:hypothetical protein